MSLQTTTDPGIPGLVSIVIPCYGGARFVRGAIESCLRQSYGKIEIIVVDDASPDDSAAIASRYSQKDDRVRLVRRTQNGGVSRAFNSGFEVARGEYFTRLAQDDVFRDDAVQVMQRYLAADPSLGLVYSDYDCIDEDGNAVESRSFPEPEVALRTGYGVGLCFMWTRKAWNEIGGFDPVFDAAEDYEFWLRLVQRFSTAKTRGPAQLLVRFHGGMGSQVHGARQEIASARARALYCPSALRGRKLLSQGYFEAGYIDRSRRRFLPALRHLAAAIWYWPFALKNYRCLAGLLLGRPPQTV
jgi:glycosyltransferase involved in cell wall biosynthesis